MIKMIQLISRNQVMSTSVETRIVKRGILILQFFLVVALGQALELGELKKKAEKGDKVAQFQLAYIYEYGGEKRSELDASYRWSLHTYGKRDVKIINETMQLARTINVEENLEKALEWYRKSSNQGLALAQDALGSLLGESANGDEEKIKEAIKWLTKAAKKKYAVAQNGLGVIYSVGMGVPMDYELAKSWYLKSANQGYATAQSNLSNLYMIGTNLGKITFDRTKMATIKELPEVEGVDFKEAVRWLRAAANQGYTDAQINLGGLYLEGKGVERDVEQGISLIRKAVDQDEPFAQFNMGWLFFEDVVIEQDYKKALMWFNKSAENGWGGGQLWVGKLLVTGTGVEKDTAKGFEWLLKAAEQGLVDAQHDVSICYFNGIGVEESLTEGAKWSRVAAENGHSDSQNTLGQLLYHGQGVKRNRSEALKWFKKTAESGMVHSQYMLGGSLFHGEGIEKDFAEAFKWLTLAGEFHEGARKELSNLNAEISPEQMAEGLKRVDEYKNARGGLR